MNSNDDQCNCDLTDAEIDAMLDGNFSRRNIDPDRAAHIELTHRTILGLTAKTGSSNQVDARFAEFMPTRAVVVPTTLGTEDEGELPGDQPDGSAVGAGEVYEVDFTAPSAAREVRRRVSQQLVLLVAVIVPFVVIGLVVFNRSSPVAPIADETEQQIGRAHV